MSKDSIHIDYLCNQPFWKFTKTGTDEYCKVCKHKINDFTTLDSHSSIETIKELGGETCGTFLNGQFTEDESTSQGNSLIKLLLAGSVTALLTTNVNAQGVKDSIKTEQLSSNNLENKTASPEQITEDCLTTTRDNAISNSGKKRKRSYIRLHKIYIYINSDFPFLHIRKMRRGKVSYKPWLPKPQIQQTDKREN
ncbi:MAG: hypothetical protein WAQ28_01495 [Bacteroidia bacterium]